MNKNYKYPRLTKKDQLESRDMFYPSNNSNHSPTPNETSHLTR
jgi:hypothetical protein